MEVVVTHVARRRRGLRATAAALLVAALLTAGGSAAAQPPASPVAEAQQLVDQGRGQDALRLLDPWLERVQQRPALANAR
jgi:hypothetical protein